MNGNNIALNTNVYFSGLKGESARQFIEELEESFDMDNVKEDKYKKYYFKKKLRGLPSNWYEHIIKNDKTYANWDDVKSAFLDQFDKNIIRPKDVMAKLMNIKQNADEDEYIESLSIRIACLFNEYEEATGKPLDEMEKIEYFIDSLYPALKEQLNNLYENENNKGYADEQLLY